MYTEAGTTDLNQKHAEDKNFNKQKMLQVEEKASGLRGQGCSENYRQPSDAGRVCGRHSFLQRQAGHSEVDCEGPGDALRFFFFFDTTGFWGRGLT